jgi:hypothetical protein
VALPAVIVQLMAGDRPVWLLTCPLPVPPPVTVRVNFGTPLPVNVARTLRLWVIVTRQVGAVPEQFPLHPVKVLPLFGIAVRSTWVLQP